MTPISPAKRSAKAIASSQQLLQMTKLCISFAPRGVSLLASCNCLSRAASVLPSRLAASLPTLRRSGSSGTAPVHSTARVTTRFGVFASRVRETSRRSGSSRRSAELSRDHLEDYRALGILDAIDIPFVKLPGSIQEAGLSHGCALPAGYMELAPHHLANCGRPASCARRRPW